LDAGAARGGDSDRGGEGLTTAVVKPGSEEARERGGLRSMDGTSVTPQNERLWWERPQAAMPGRGTCDVVWVSGPGAAESRSDRAATRPWAGGARGHRPVGQAERIRRRRSPMSASGSPINASGTGATT